MAYNNEQAGLEVVTGRPEPYEKIDKHLQHPSNDPAFSAPIPIRYDNPSFQSIPQPPAAYGGYGAGITGDVPHFTTDHIGGASGGGGAGKEGRICGLKRWLFILLVVLGVLIIGGAVGGGVGGYMASRDKSSGGGDDGNGGGGGGGNETSTTSTTSSATPAPTPGTIAAVRTETEFGSSPREVEITYFFQDIHTPDIYMTRYTIRDGWQQVGKLEGLNPEPRANSTIAATRAPGEDVITFYYTSSNGTLYDANGTTTSTQFQMGFLAPTTGYGILVSPDSGMSAIWWGALDDSGPGYRRRIYYVDRGASRVQELAFDADKTPQWFVTNALIEACSPNTKIAATHIPPNATSYERETVHLFYQNRDGLTRHYPSYNGLWDYNNVETIVETTVPIGGYMAATVDIDDGNDYPLRLWYLDSSGRLSVLEGEGNSPRHSFEFVNNGTFEDRELVQGFTGTKLTNGEVSGGPVAALGWMNGGSDEELRVYYRAKRGTGEGEADQNGVVEVSNNAGDAWGNRVVEVVEEDKEPERIRRRWRGRLRR